MEFYSIRGMICLQPCSSETYNQSASRASFFYMELCAPDEPSPMAGRWLETWSSGWTNVLDRSISCLQSRYMSAERYLLNNGGWKPHSIARSETWDLEEPSAKVWKDPGEHATLLWRYPPQAKRAKWHWLCHQSSGYWESCTPSLASTGQTGLLKRPPKRRYDKAAQAATIIVAPPTLWIPSKM